MFEEQLDDIRVVVLRSQVQRRLPSLTPPTKHRLQLGLVTQVSTSRAPATLTPCVCVVLCVSEQ